MSNVIRGAIASISPDDMRFAGRMAGSFGEIGRERPMPLTET